MHFIYFCCVIQLDTVVKSQNGSKIYSTMCIYLSLIIYVQIKQKKTCVYSRCHVFGKHLFVCSFIQM